MLPWFMYENSVFIVRHIDTRDQDVLDVLQEQFQVVERREKGLGGYGTETQKQTAEKEER